METEGLLHLLPFPSAEVVFFPAQRVLALKPLVRSLNAKEFLLLHQCFDLLLSFDQCWSLGIFSDKSGLDATLPRTVSYRFCSFGSHGPLIIWAVWASVGNLLAARAVVQMVDAAVEAMAGL